MRTEGERKKERDGIERERDCNNPFTSKLHIISLSSLEWYPGKKHAAYAW